MTLSKKKRKLEVKYAGEAALADAAAEKQTVLEHLAEQRKYAEQHLAGIHTAAAQAQALGIGDMPYRKVAGILSSGGSFF